MLGVLQRMVMISVFFSCASTIALHYVTKPSVSLSFACVFAISIQLFVSLLDELYKRDVRFVASVT